MCFGVWYVGIGEVVRGMVVVVNLIVRVRFIKWKILYLYDLGFIGVREFFMVLDDREVCGVGRDQFLYLYRKLRIYCFVVGLSLILIYVHEMVSLVNGMDLVDRHEMIVGFEFLCSIIFDMGNE